MKTKIFALMIIFIALTLGCKKDSNENVIPKSDPLPISGPDVTDIDGNIYHSVVVGTQIWMAENLKTTHYQNGDLIPNVTNNTQWSVLSTGAYCNYNNDTNNVIIYGRLYNWYAIQDSRNIAPVGWHIPSDAEWTTLTNYLGGESVAGGKLKEVGTIHWQSPNIGATNETGFTALPSGSRFYDGTFLGVVNYGHWWSATGVSANQESAYGRGMICDSSSVWRGEYYKISGFSVRCVKD